MKPIEESNEYNRPLFNEDRLVLVSMLGDRTYRLAITDRLRRRRAAIQDRQGECENFPVDYECSVFCGAGVGLQVIIVMLTPVMGHITPPEPGSHKFVCSYRELLAILGPQTSMSYNSNVA